MDKKQTPKFMCLPWEINTKQFVNNPGNGKAVPQFEMVQKGGKNVIVPKLDENGKQVTRNLYAEIQIAKGQCDIAEIIKRYPEKVTAVPNWGNSNVCTEKEQDLDDYLNAQRAVNAAGGWNELDKKFNEILEIYKKRIAAQQAAQQKDSQKQEVKEDEKNKK